MNDIVPLDRHELARIAPNYEAMRTAIAKCEKVDEIAELANKAKAIQAYYRQSLDVENEMSSSRIRVRAERRLGEILKKMASNGERQAEHSFHGNQYAGSRRASQQTLKDLGIPADRASRAILRGEQGATPT